MAQSRSLGSSVRFNGTFDKGNLVFQTTGFSTPDYLEGMDQPNACISRNGRCRKPL